MSSILEHNALLLIAIKSEMIYVAQQQRYQYSVTLGGSSESGFSRYDPAAGLCHSFSDTISSPIWHVATAISSSSLDTLWLHDFGTN